MLWNSRREKKALHRFQLFLSVSMLSITANTGRAKCKLQEYSECNREREV